MKKESSSLVSIVMPVYNSDKYVEEALTDLYNQSYKNIELVVVDNNSTDNSVEIVQESLRKCPFPYQFITEEQQGTGAALNKGFLICNGDYFSWVSADDKKEINFIENLTNILDSNQDVGFSFSSFRIISQEGVPQNNINFNYLLPGKIVSPIFMDICTRDYVVGICFMWRSSLMGQFGLFPHEPGEDYYMAVKFGMLTDFFYDASILGSWRSHSDNLSAKILRGEAGTGGAYKALELLKQYKISLGEKSEGLAC